MMCLLTEAHNVYDIMKTFHYFARAYGFWPEEFESYLSSRVIFTLRGIMYFSLKLLINGYLLYATGNPEPYQNITNSKILNNGLWVQAVYSMLLCITLKLYSLSNCQLRIKLIQLMFSIDETLQNDFHMVYHYTGFKRYIFAAATISVVEVYVVFGVTCYLLSNLQFETTQYIHVLLTILMSNMFMWTNICHYSSLLLFLNIRFFNLNSVLRQLLLEESMEDLVFVTKTGMRKHPPKTSKPTPNTISVGLTETDAITLAMDEENAFTMRWKNIIEMCTKTYVSDVTYHRQLTVNSTIDKLRILIELHCTLSKLVVSVNHLYAFPLLMIMFSIFSYTVFGLFAAYRVWNDYQMEANCVAQMNLFWMSMYIFSILIIVNLSTLVTNETKKTGIIVHRIIWRNQNQLLIKKLMEISQLLASSRIVIGFGMIEYNWPFVYSLCGYTLMYLAILIQFYESFKSQL